MARELSTQLGRHGWRSVLCFRSEPVDSVRRFLELPNVRVEVIRDMSRWSLPSNLQLAKVIKRYRPYIAHFSFTDFFAPHARLARLCGVRRVFFTDQISRPIDYVGRRAPISKRLLYRSVVPVSMVFCVSEFVKQSWIDAGCYPQERITTVYNSIDLERCRRSIGSAYGFREKHAIQAEDIVVTQVASMIPEKGFPMLLESARRVVDVNPRVCFVLAGDGQYGTDYQAMAQRLGLDKHVRFVGLVDDPVGEGLFAASDIVCQVSQWNEAFGLVIAEAMAAAKPVVGTRVGAIPELIQDGKNGFLVGRNDTGLLASRILELAGNPSLRSELGLHGRRLCERLFDHRKNCAAMIGHYGLQPQAGAGRSH